MKKSLIIVAFLIASSANVRADDDCYVPLVEWQPREAVTALAQKNGWDISRLRVDDGCYKIRGTDSDGRRIEMKLNPKTLEIVVSDKEDEHKRHDDDDD